MSFQQQAVSTGVGSKYPMHVHLLSTLEFGEDSKESKMTSQLYYADNGDINSTKTSTGSNLGLISCYLHTKSKLRVGVLPLEIETGRHSRTSIPLENRICTLCNHNICESEQHFLLECPLYCDQRESLIDLACTLHHSFAELSVTEQFVFLMSTPQVQGCLSKTVMFFRRQIFKTK